MRKRIHQALLLISSCMICTICGLSQTMTCAGGPPVYCARQDWANEYSIPAHVAPQGIAGAVGAGEMMVSPDFGERVVRLSDPNVYANITTHQAMTGFGGDYQGSDEAEPISLNDDFFFLQDNGGNTVLYSFDPVNLVPRRLYQTSYPTTNGLVLADGGKALIWSPVQDDVLYEWGMPASDYEIWHWTFSSLTTPPGSSTLDVNLTTTTACDVLPASPEWYSALSVSNDGNEFAVSASSSGQDTATIAVVWQKSTNECAWINVSNGQYGGNLGGSGTISGLTTGAIHNVRLLMGGEWLRIDYPSADSNSTVFWDIGTGTAYYCEGNAGPCGGGHIANGYDLVINGIGANLSPYFPKLYGAHNVLSSNPLAYNLLSTSVPVKGADTHINWAMDNPSNNMPFALSGDDDGYNAYAWDDEVDAVSTNLSSKGWRFMRTWSLEENYYFEPGHSIGQASRDGKFFMLTTDWGGQFGSVESASISSWSRSGNTVTVTAPSGICASGTFLTGDTFTIQGASLGTGGTSINGTWVGSFTTIAAPTGAPSGMTTSTTGGYIPANTVVTVGYAYTSNALNTGCYTTVGPTSTIETGSSTSTNTVSVPSPPTETGAAGWVAFACVGSNCTPISQDDTAIGTSETIGTHAASAAAGNGLWVVGYYGSTSNWIDHLPPPAVNGANGNTMTFTQNAANDSSSTASGNILDEYCNVHYSTGTCRYDAVMVEMK